MTLSPRRSRLAAAAFLALLALSAHAQTDVPAPAAPTSPAPIIEPTAPPGAPRSASVPPAAPAEAAQPSALTAELFYEVLMGEITSRQGDPGSGFALLLDAARRSKDGQLFQRAVEIALQSRSGDAALEAARAWKQTIPDSRDARRFELQILIALNRIGETAELLRAEIAATPQIERPVLMTIIARNYTRATDKKLAASVVEQALQDEIKTPGSAGAAWGTIGRLRFAAGDVSGALEAVQRGLESDPSSENIAALALELMDPSRPQAEQAVKRYLASAKPLPEVRVAYARVLVEGRRYAEATTELTAVTKERPEIADPWLLLGSLQAQAKQDGAAETSIKRYLELIAAQRDAEVRERGQTQAYLLMSQMAERRKDFQMAESWLSRIDSGDDAVGALARRAGLLARQGKVPQAREVIRSLPERTPDEKKQKFLAEVQLLRDAKQYQAAYDMLAQANTAAPDDADLIYDRAMVAEKLNRLDEMERLLRRLIELKPESQNAYNALGYSFADRKIKLEEARTLIRKAVSLAPDDPFIADSLGWVEFRLGNLDEAAKILEDAYRKRPDPEIGAHLGEVLWAKGQRDRAVTVWKEASLADDANETLQETLKRLRVKL